MAMTDQFTQPLSASRAPPSLYGSGKDEHHTSSIWQAAIDRFYAELRRGGVKGPAIDRSIHSPDELLQHIKALSPADSLTPGSLRRLEPILLSINDFVTVMTLYLGMNGQVAPVTWGSIRLIIKFAQPVLPELLDMFEELGRALPRFRKCEEKLPMTRTLEDALIETYTEVIVFCAHSIAFFRNNPNITKKRGLWSGFSKDFANVISNIRRYSKQVDEAADLIRLTREIHAADAIEIIKNFQLDDSKEMNLPCYSIPYGINLKFFGRSAERDALEKILSPKENPNKLNVVAIYGTGGVGKTQLALDYANTFMHQYDAVLWIPAETQIKMAQAVASLTWPPKHYRWRGR